MAAEVAAGFGMIPTLPVTRKQATLLRALASLAAVQPEKARAAHLVRPALEWAEQIERATTQPEEVR